MSTTPPQQSPEQCNNDTGSIKCLSSSPTDNATVCTSFPNQQTILYTLPHPEQEEEDDEQDDMDFACIGTWTPSEITCDLDLQDDEALNHLSPVSTLSIDDPLSRAVSPTISGIDHDEADLDDVISNHDVISNPSLSEISSTSCDDPASRDSKSRSRRILRKICCINSCITM